MKQKHEKKETKQNKSKYFLNRFEQKKTILPCGRNIGINQKNSFAENAAKLIIFLSSQNRS
jgi:hypothetical protein